MLFVGFSNNDKKIIQTIDELNVSELKKNGQKTPSSIVAFFLSRSGQEWLKKTHDPKAISLLCNASLKKEEAEALALFLSNHPSIFTPKGVTPLHAIAMEWQDSYLAWRVIQKFKKNGISVANRDIEGMTALHYAAHGGKVKISKALLQGEKEDILFIPDHVGRTAWHWAVMKRGNKVSHLFQSLHKGSTAKEASQTDHFKKTVVDYAHQTRQNGLAIRLGETRLASKDRSLFMAISEGDIEKSRELILEGKELHEIDESGYTPLGAAVGKGDRKMARLLLQYGCNINQRMEDGITPLLIAIERNNSEMVELLLEEGADPNMCCNWNSRSSTPLYRAEQLGHTEIAGVLKKYGAFKVDDSLAVMAGVWATTADLGPSVHLSGGFSRLKGLAVFKDYAAGYLNSETFARLPGRLRQNLLNTVANTKIIGACNSQSLAQRIRDGETVLLQSGWKGHGTSTLFATVTINGEKQLLVAEGNRGAKASGHYGITVSHIRDATHLEEVLETLKKQRNSKDGVIFHSPEIKKALNLEHKYYLPEPAQTVGNCWWANMGSGLKAAIFFELLSEYSSNKSLELAQKLHGGFDRYGQQRSLEDYQKEGKDVKDLPLALRLKIEKSRLKS